jgi:Poly(A) polymerase catalytic subunit
MKDDAYNCEKGLTPNECELDILRHKVDEKNLQLQKSQAENPEIKRSLKILEAFLKRKKLICYGGISINAILPKKFQFYNYELEIPDYDFFSPNALHDAKELADIFASKGFQEVEAKSGVHHGTFKVFVNFIGVADCTQLDMELFENLKKEAIVRDGVLYCPPNFLRMSMYLELSRPNGDITRWEKVLKRLALLNQFYPLKERSCFHIDFQRDMDNNDQERKIFNLTKNFLVEKGTVFFGSFAILQYSQYMPSRYKKKLEKIPDFDVLSTDAEKHASELKTLLLEHGIEDCNIFQFSSLGELVSSHYQVKVKNDTIVYIYTPLACHSYNKIKTDNGDELKVATIETMMSFYLAFLYSSRPYYDRNRILCMAQYLFEVQQKNRLEQKGLLKRFSLECYGNQPTLIDMRVEKEKKYKELKGQYGNEEYEEWFLRYRPSEMKNRFTFKTNVLKTNKKKSIKRLHKKHYKRRKKL